MADAGFRNLSNPPCLIFIELLLQLFDFFGMSLIQLCSKRIMRRLNLSLARGTVRFKFGLIPLLQRLLFLSDLEPERFTLRLCIRNGLLCFPVNFQ